MRVVVEGQPLMYGRPASVQVEMDQMLVGPLKYLAQGDMKTPLPLRGSMLNRSLRLVVQGDAHIYNVMIRVGQVRSHYSSQLRLAVHQELGQHQVLELGRFMPYENRLVRSITLEARSRFAQAHLSLMTMRGEFLGSALVTQVPLRPVIHLSRPVSIQELRIHAAAPVSIDSVTLEL
jgi:hypothetical protein